MTYYNLNSKKNGVHTVCFKNVFPREVYGSHEFSRNNLPAALPRCMLKPNSNKYSNLKESELFTQPAEGVCLEDELPGLGFVAIGSPLFISHEKDIWKGNVALLRGDLLTIGLLTGTILQVHLQTGSRKLFFCFFLFFYLYMGGFSNYLCLPGRGTYSAHVSITAGPSHNSGCP